MTLLAELVSASERVAATPARSEKIAILAELLARLEPVEVAAATGFLSGVPRQGRVGVGYATVVGLECEPAAAPSLEIGELDVAIARLQGTAGSGSAAARREVLVALLSRATGP